MLTQLRKLTQHGRIAVLAVALLTLAALGVSAGVASAQSQAATTATGWFRASKPER